MIYARPARLGLVPAVVGGAVLIESAWAWYDPDTFTDLWLEADQEQQVINLNNWWAQLESTSWKTLSEDSPARRRLNGNLDAWVQWKDEYNEAILRRWLPGGRDWEQELSVWYERFRESSAEVAEAGGREAELRIAEAGIDPRMLPEMDRGALEELQEAIGETIEQAGEAAGQAGEGAGRGFLWPALAAGASVGIIIWLATRTPARRTA